MVNEAAIGGPAWPTQKVFDFWVPLGNGKPIGLEHPFDTVRQALDSGAQKAPPPPTNKPAPADVKIPPELVADAQAAAARLDHYCDTHP